MRLLCTTSDERPKWSKDYIGNEEIPNYTILSNTWKDGQEVTFDDLNEGYRKLRFCAHQAKRDGLDYFWVITCCIDKSNSSELQEAINSIFRWYQHAARCYVYLPDVEQNTLDEDGESAFKRSRWFTRSWTLQELLAPKSVEFFSSKGVRLGDKESLRHTIHKITGIPVDALQGSRLSEFTTTREEDGAYCLLGIFGIYMSLIYGEGKDNAIKRLQKQLSAPDPSTNYHKAHKQRQAETGLWLLEDK
ncbi:HET-domain-containing protein [Macroventuria anomochaeta]|uniref:HET-domain-containing protein n=1 Tax=Macroventuria anomochaeta TaxID=301207 RepID=A0ACB6RIK2_9PLEO|nr:HET-domain-containing protein [Macroventuria anomochaeta]KAF2621589.1 HET-domain-containing protein [Macroventuria anomochaeta]